MRIDWYGQAAFYLSRREGTLFIDPIGDTSGLAARGMKLLVGGPGRAQRELLDAVSAPRRMRVAVDEARDRAQPPPVDLLHVAVERSEVTHSPDRLDPALGAEDVRVLEHRDSAEIGAAPRSRTGCRRRDFNEVADEQPHYGVCRPCSRAAATASS